MRLLLSMASVVLVSVGVNVFTVRLVKSDSSSLLVAVVGLLVVFSGAVLAYWLHLDEEIVRRVANVRSTTKTDSEVRESVLRERRGKLLPSIGALRSMAPWIAALLLLTAVLLSVTC